MSDEPTYTVNVTHGPIFPRRPGDVPYEIAPWPNEDADEIDNSVFAEPPAAGPS